jgi:hypothetical protein
MSNHHTIEPAPTYTDLRAGTDLTIHEFDQWTNTNDPTFSPTTICWGSDGGSEAAA